MTNQSNTPDDSEVQPLPDCPELALFIGRLFRRLGGELHIGNGRRYISLPEPVLFRINGKGLPQLPDAKLTEQFHSAEEWRGALKVAHYWLTRLSDADRGFVFTYFASLSVNAPGDFDFREHLH